MPWIKIEEKHMCLQPRLPDPQAGPGSIWECPDCGKRWEVFMNALYYYWQEYTGMVILKESEHEHKSE